MEAALAASPVSDGTTGDYCPSKMKALLRVAGAFALASATVISTLAATPGTARACSCIQQDLSNYADEVTVAFVGTQVSREIYEEDISDFTVQRAAMVLEVERVYKGDVGPRIEIHSNADGPACGIDFGYYPGAGIVAFEHEGQLWAGWCSNPVEISELEEVFGAGYPPGGSIESQTPSDTAPPLTVPPDFAQADTPTAPQTPDVAAPPPTAPSGSAQPDTPTEPLAPDGNSESLLNLVIALVAVAAAAVLTVGVLAVRRRRRQPPVA